MHNGRVIEISRSGPPEVLQIQERSIPAPGPEEVLIDVKAIGLNFADIFERMGLYKAAPKPPFVPGFEVAGTIAEVGKDVTDFDLGQKVIGITRFGGYTTKLKVHKDFVLPLPKHFSLEEGAGLPTTYLTAYHGLFNLGHLHTGENVLIHAGAGGVGTAAIQMAQIVNAKIFATCGSDKKVAFLRTLGVKYAINYNTHDFEAEIRRLNAGGGVDLIMDSVGGETFKKGYRLLNPMGRLIIFGLGSMMPGGKRANWIKLAYQYLRLPRFNAFDLMPENKTISGFNLVYMFQFLEVFRASIQQLLAWANEGKIKPIVGKTFRFEEVIEAQNFLHSRESVGKVILTV